MMSNFYLCDTCKKKSADVLQDEFVPQDGCICWAARVPKVVVMDGDERPLKDICPYGWYEERDDQ